jgi:hypothetical protein
VRQSNSGLDKSAAGEWTGIALAMKESPLPGDYNSNGVVDAADYTVWRDNLGRSAGGGLVFTARGDSPGANYAVPEPSTFALAAFILCASFQSRRSRLRFRARLPREGGGQF